MKKPIAALCAATDLIGGAGTAAAHTKHTPTTVLIDETDYITVDTFMMRGHLETPRKCRANRRIKVYIRYLSDPSQWTLVDQGTSTTTGYWIGTGDDDGVNGWRITATRKNVGRPRHRHICDAGVFQN